MQNTEYLRWKESSVLTAEQRQELAALTDPEEINDRFYRTLAFGTAGLRGVMGMGLNRMNEYIVRQATLAFARVIRQAGLAEQGVCVCYDCRINARFYAEQASLVLRAEGIPVWLFEQCRPTPQLSFAVRQKHAAAGINVTASHNPKAYSGYKVYWEGGAQLPPDKAELVAREMARIDPLTPAPEGKELAPLTLLGAEHDEAYIEAVLKCTVDPNCLRQADDRFSVVYTPYHGVGGPIVPEVLRRAGLKKLYCVAEQMEPDGTFPTLDSPNPENPEGFALAIALAKRQNAPVIIGTDPDSDRVAIVVRDRSGEYVPISGNRTGALLIHYLLTAGAEQHRLPEHPALVTTLVTSRLAQKIALQKGAAVFETFTGFKYMAQKVSELEQEGIYHYVMAFEESIGYMMGDHARDKDGVVGSLLLCEMAAWYHNRGLTVLDGLDAIFREYGWHGEQTRNVMLPGQDGAARMQRILSALRQTPPKTFLGAPVTAWRDYDSGLRHTAEGDEKLELQGSNVLIYELPDGERLAIRPSGTEPKIKIYALMCGSSLDDADDRADRCAAEAEQLILNL